MRWGFWRAGGGDAVAGGEAAGTGGKVAGEDLAGVFGAGGVGAAVLSGDLNRFARKSMRFWGSDGAWKRCKLIMVRGLWRYARVCVGYAREWGNDVS